MIDDLISVLAKEQTDDDDKKEWCEISFDSTDDKKKSLERAIADSEAAVNDAEESIATLTSEIKALQESIKALDSSVASATEQRKEEHAEYNDLIASNAAAVELLGVAKNRLNKYYNPALYKAPPQRVLSEEDQIVVNMGGTAPPTPAPGGIAGTGITAFVQVRSHMRLADAPVSPPKSFSAYSSKSGDSAGVVAMIDLLVKDLEKETTVAKTEEANSQETYEQMSADAAEKRAADVSALTDKEAAKANGEAALQAHAEDKASSTKELMATAEYISSLHGDCDWLVSNFDVRKDARTNEVDSLKKAKAVLAGADYSLVQTRVRNLRGHM
jgi:chromosome segregation ATPase